MYLLFNAGNKVRFMRPCVQVSFVNEEPKYLQNSNHNSTFCTTPSKNYIFEHISEVLIVYMII
ncbi:hypothetical protein FF38_11819 [Lucilia cuprina]|uniref:Uncharacterized protein n=1 Tax=Lucilia cuprina TaxID=7375 RepID=A0A0L0BYE5_LUCCU|nr:hypothetical protein FF38_11819 [Lucilia cuprina]